MAALGVFTTYYCENKFRRNTEKEKTAHVKFLTDLTRSIERCRTELLEKMEEQQKAAEKQEEELIEELEQEITELKMRNTELEQLSHTEDHLHLLQIYSSLYSPKNTRNWPEISVKTHESLETLRRALTQLKNTIDEKLTQTVSTELKWMQQYAVDVTLDPDTASPYLILSDDGKQVRDGDIEQKLSDKPERFDKCLCVLGKEGFSSGRFYFEVQVKGKTEWDLGVARESINRKGKITLSPSNGYWTVWLRNGNEYKACDDPPVSLCLRVNPQRVGVFVDYEEGLVSFYDVESSSHIYSYTGQSFTEKLYPYFSPSLNYEGKNSNPLIITPVNDNK
ncbi:Zinc-binding protein A33 [Labeo rohita]|uniref:Zinc-binding protein A33 n=1 Tax=Labeo rohita TaxID=84645 RepID=A0ABQ8L4I8_LABRO|nr:Zinc-binding protein A33 [Labeo rohita]